MKNQLIFPMAMYVLFIWGSAVHMFRTRVKAVKSGQVSLKYFKAHLGEPPPENVAAVANHYDNQFQVPMLFMIVCTLHIVLSQVNALTVILAWAFFISRGIHSWILLGNNILMNRAKVFAIGWVIVLILWAQLVYFALNC